MPFQRLRAPSADGATLESPPLAEAAGPLADNIRRLGAWTHDFQGRRADRLRELTRQRRRELARDYHAAAGLETPADVSADAPLIVTGHQPELYHPGVWVKNFAVDALARRFGGAAINFVVDNDLPKSPELRVPTLEDDRLRTHLLAFDSWTGKAPFEDQKVHDESIFASFGARALETLGGIVPDSLIRDFWPRAVALRDRTDRVGLRFAIARHQVEAEWGVHNREFTLGRLCETDSFAWFASHLLAHLPRFRDLHNDALAHYRRAHGIRSRNHPVADLGTQGEWLEAPFWAWRASSPRRRPLLVRQRGSVMDLRLFGEDEPLVELPLAPDRDACCAVERLLELPSRGVRLRTRALTTTMFARLLLGDLFLHGIGGAKYDELGDEIVRGFFGIEPPAYLTLSLTLWLGVGHEGGTARSLEEVEHALRDLTFNPDRHLEGAEKDEATELVDAKHAAQRGPVATRKQRVHRFREIRRLNAMLVPHVSAVRDRLLTRRDELTRRAASDRIARSREVAFVLHDERRLRNAMGRMASAVGPD